MLNIQKTINFYGRCEGTEIDEMGNKVAYATMDASISHDGSININKYTSSATAYTEHAEEIEADWATFEEEVHKYAQAEIVTK